MPFIDKLFNYKSLSIVGLEKNSGKTECLNYILRRISTNQFKIAVSSIGIDGESIDQVTKTHKPEIILKEGIYFTTSEKHYKQRRISSEILDISEQSTSLGRLITAKSLSKGKILLSGPASSAAFSKWISQQQNRYNVDLCIVDGALSRLSIASPAVSESMILTTGAALSINMNELIQQTSHVVDLINLPLNENINIKSAIKLDSGIFFINKNGSITESKLNSAFSPDFLENSIEDNIDAIYLTGALTDRFINRYMLQKEYCNKAIIVKDFTKIFITNNTYNRFKQNGGLIQVLRKSNLIAVCVNPISPNGYKLDSDTLCKKLSDRILLPVYNVLKDEYTI